MEKAEEILKKIKNIMQKAGCDMSAVRNLRKSLEKAQKQLPGMSAKYKAAKEAATQVEALAKRLEELLLCPDGHDKVWSRQVLDIGRTLKKIRGSFAHEFVISGVDKEFYLTYDSLIALIGAVTTNTPDFLIMRSETENLLDLLKETQQRPQPPLLELSYFYLAHTDAELVGLSVAEQIQLLKSNMREQFVMPMGQQIGLAVKYVVTRYRQLAGDESRQAVAEREELKILLPEPQTSEAANQMIRQMLKEMMQAEG